MWKELANSEKKGEKVGSVFQKYREGKSKKDKEREFGRSGNSGTWRETRAHTRKMSPSFRFSLPVLSDHTSSLHMVICGTHSGTGGRGEQRGTDERILVACPPPSPLYTMSSEVKQQPPNPNLTNCWTTQERTVKCNLLSLIPWKRRGGQRCQRQALHYYQKGSSQPFLLWRCPTHAAMSKIKCTLFSKSSSSPLS